MTCFQVYSTSGHYGGGRYMSKCFFLERICGASHTGVRQRSGRHIEVANAAQQLALRIDTAQPAALDYKQTSKLNKGRAIWRFPFLVLSLCGPSFPDILSVFEVTLL